MTSFFWTSMAVVLASLLAPELSAAEGDWSKRDDRGPVAVTVTLIEAPTVGSPVKIAGHHREAVLAFPPPPSGARDVRIAIRNVGDVGERDFAWDLPIGR